MRKIVLAVTLSTLFIGCVHDINDLTFTQLKPGISIPVGKFTLGADNLNKLGDSLLVREGESGVIEFYYESELLRSSLTERFTIKDQVFNDEIPFSSFIFVAGQTNEVKVSNYNSFKISNSDLPDPPPSLKKATLKSGMISIVQTKNFDHDVETIITFPTLIKNGTALTMTIAGNSTLNESLEGYELSLAGSSGLETNTVEYEISTTISNTGSSSSGVVAIDFSMNSMLFSYLEGDFGTYNFDFVEGEFDLGLPENEVPDNVAFTNPTVNLLVDNSAGIGFGLTIDEISAIYDNGDQTIVTGSFDDDPISLNQAPSPGEKSTSDFSISGQNTDNLIDLLSNIPQSVLFKGTAVANPNGTPVNGNFITDSSEVVINAELILPLEGYADNYALVDTLNDINLTFDEDGVVELDEINLRLFVENNFPFEVRLQLYFLDSLDNSKVLDSLFSTLEEQKIIPTALVNANGIASESTEVTNDISIDNDKYNKITSTGSIKLVAHIFTPGADETPRESVKFTNTNYLTVGIGISASALIDLNNIDNNN